MNMVTTLEARFEDINLNVVDISDFNERVVGAYNNGTAEKDLAADDNVARSVIPAGTGALRDFSYIAPDIPEFVVENCVGCMDCVTQCPDTAILAKVADPSTLTDRLATIPDEELRNSMGAQWVATQKYYTVLEKKGLGGGKFGIFIDPTKCKGCAECVDACGDHDALKMIRKDDKNLAWYKAAFKFYRDMPETPSKFINEKALSDMMLTERSLLYVGGAGSCAGCGEAAMLDIGFQSLSRMLASGMDIKVIVLDTQVYSNTGGQTSTGSFKGQDAKMSAHGTVIFGKKENRKEIGNICMMHKDVYVAQTTCAHPNHFYKAVMEANAYPGPAIVNVFTTCQPEHGVADNMAEHQAKLAADSRTFPVFIYDPRKGARFRERLSLVGNPNVKEDWYVNPKTGEQIDFVYFARTEGRFAKQFDKEGKPSATLLSSQQERLENWRLLQDLAGIK